MRHAAFLFGVFLLYTGSVGAQVNSSSSPLSGSSDSGGALSASVSPSTFSPTAGFATTAMSAPNPLAGDLAVPSRPEGQEPPVFGVFQHYDWQVYAGYTFLRFYEVPHVTRNTNGIDLAAAYYPKGGHIAGDGEFLGTWGSSNVKFALALGGVRFRWAIPRGLELWGHAMGGGAHFLPQTAFGGQGAWAYEVGGGVDIPVRNHGRFAYRASADMVGTRFFGTNQYSPKVSVGVAFKF